MRPRRVRLADDRQLENGSATIVIVGVGRVGTMAYDHVRRLRGQTVVGVDVDLQTVQRQADSTAARERRCIGLRSPTATHLGSRSRRLMSS